MWYIDVCACVCVRVHFTVLVHLETGGVYISVLLLLSILVNETHQRPGDLYYVYCLGEGPYKS